MTRQPILLDPFQGVGAGQRATLNIAPGYRYHELCLNLATTLVAGTAITSTSTQFANDVALTELVIANKVQRRYTGEQLVMLTQFIGETFRANFLHIPFSEKDRATIFGEEALAWGTMGLSNPAFQLKCTMASGIYISTFQVFAERDVLNTPIGSIVKTYETTIQVSAAGVVTWNPDYSRGDKIRRVHIKDNGTITAAQVYANNVLEYDVTAASNIERLKRAGFVPQTTYGYFHIVHDIDKQVLSNMDTARPVNPAKPNDLFLLNSLAYRLTFSSSGNYTALVEVIGPPD